MGMRGLTRPAHLSFVAGAAGPAMSFRPPDLLRGNPMDFSNIRSVDRMVRIVTGIYLTGASFLLPGPFFRCCRIHVRPCILTGR